MLVPEDIVCCSARRAGELSYSSKTPSVHSPVPTCSHARTTAHLFWQSPLTLPGVNSAPGSPLPEHIYFLVTSLAAAWFPYLSALCLQRFTAPWLSVPPCSTVSRDSIFSFASVFAWHYGLPLGFCRCCSKSRNSWISPFFSLFISLAFSFHLNEHHAP